MPIILRNNFSQKMGIYIPSILYAMKNCQHFLQISFFAIMKYNPKYVMLTIFFQALSNSAEKQVHKKISRFN